MPASPHPDRFPRSAGRQVPARSPWVVVGVVALLAMVGLAVVEAEPTPSRAATAVKIMPLGDSLTGGPGCWRASLWTDLLAGGYTDIDFVGTLPGGGCDVADWDGDNEGHGGYLAITTAEENLLPGWLSETDPDIVMMTFGTNDVWNNRSTGDIIAAFNTLLGQMREHNPDIELLVAQIPPVAAPGCSYCESQTVALNAVIPGWASQNTTEQSPITVVDQWTGWDPDTDTIDGVHQSDSGNQKMSDIWYTALTDVLETSAGPSESSPESSAESSATGSPSATVSGSPSTSTSATTAPACSAAYSVVSAWSDGFQAEVTVTAGKDGVSAWTVTWVPPVQGSVSQVWNATLTTDDTIVTATSVSWNSLLAPYASTTFGLIATGQESGYIPELFCAAA